MATFRASMSEVEGDGTSLSFFATVTGGDSSFTGYRVVDVYLDGVGLVASIYNYDGGSSNSFSETITGLSSGTTYTWAAYLFYAPPKGDGPGWITGYLDEVNTGLSESGTVTTYSGGGGGSSSNSAYIYNGSTWVPATPYIYNGSTWVQATSYIGSGSGWIQCV